jgi:hypothetical protein
MVSTLKGVAVVALGLFLEVAFLSSVVEARRPARAGRVVVEELAFAPAPGEAAQGADAGLPSIAKRAPHARTPVRIVVR